MKKLALLIATLTSTMAFAGMKISLRPQYHLDTGKPGVMGGVSLYQPILVNYIAVNAWVGAGYRPEPLSRAWMAGNLDIDMIMSDKLTISPGYQYRASPTLLDDDSSVGVKFAYKVW